MGWLIWGVLVGAGGLLLVWTFQRSLIYFPLAQVPPPAAVGLGGVETITFVTEDDLALAGWFVPTAEGPGYLNDVLGAVHATGELKNGDVLVTTRELLEAAKESQMKASLTKNGAGP